MSSYSLFVFPLFASHSMAPIDGAFKYPFNFKQFYYTSDRAQKGGQLTVHDIGSFDKANPFTLKGSARYLLEDLIYEYLGVSSIIPGKSITYRRTPDYWAINHPTRKGLYNFDKL